MSRSRIEMFKKVWDRLILISTFYYSLISRLRLTSNQRESDDCKNSVKKVWGQKEGQSLHPRWLSFYWALKKCHFPYQIYSAKQFIGQGLWISRTFLFSNTKSLLENVISLQNLKVLKVQTFLMNKANSKSSKCRRKWNWLSKLAAKLWHSSLGNLARDKIPRNMKYNFLLL